MSTKPDIFPSADEVASLRRDRTQLREALMQIKVSANGTGFNRDFRHRAANIADAAIAASDREVLKSYDPLS